MTIKAVGVVGCGLCSKFVGDRGYIIEKGRSWYKGSLNEFRVNEEAIGKYLTV